VRAIDRVLRERQADALAHALAHPLNPATGGGRQCADQLGLTVYGEVYNAWLDPARREEMRADLPITLGALAWRRSCCCAGGDGWNNLTQRLLQSTAILRGREVAAFVLSLSQLLVPLPGLTALLNRPPFFSRMTGPTILAWPRRWCWR
jgi:potassium-dependent mechanosensitive channel